MLDARPSQAAHQGAQERSSAPELAAGRPDAFRSGLASALNNLSVLLAAIEEIVAIPEPVVR